MPLFTTANLSLYSGKEDQVVQVSKDLWKTLVPDHDTKGNHLKQHLYCAE